MTTFFRSQFLTLSSLPLILLFLCISSTHALWPLPSYYLSGNTVLWIASDIQFHFSVLPSVGTPVTQGLQNLLSNSANSHRTRRWVAINTPHHQHSLQSFNPPFIAPANAFLKTSSCHGNFIRAILHLSPLLPAKPSSTMYTFNRITPTPRTRPDLWWERLTNHTP